MRFRPLIAPAASGRDADLCATPSGRSAPHPAEAPHSPPGVSLSCHNSPGRLRPGASPFSTPSAWRLLAGSWRRRPPVGAVTDLRPATSRAEKVDPPAAGAQGRYGRLPRQHLTPGGARRPLRPVPGDPPPGSQVRGHLRRRHPAALSRPRHQLIHLMAFRSMGERTRRRSKSVSGPSPVHSGSVRHTSPRPPSP